MSKRRLRLHPLQYRRIALLVLTVVLAVLVARSDALHQAILDVLAVAERLIREYPRSGMLIFLVLSGLSAMLTFFSSVALVPMGVYVWGPQTTMLLLLTGGSVGGMLGYWMSRTLGRRIVKRLFPGAQLRKYEEFFRTRARWSTILLFRIALQSELPSYVMGLVRYPFLRYVPMIVLGELPYVIAVVYLGEAFLQRNAALFIGVFVVAIAVTLVAWRRLQREMRASPGTPPEAAPTPTTEQPTT
jgi:uncharacterized membrane protein YdjX (TVP38/TMEM64 family)